MPTKTEPKFATADEALAAYQNGGRSDVVVQAKAEHEASKQLGEMTPAERKAAVSAAVRALKVELEQAGFEVEIAKEHEA